MRFLARGILTGGLALALAACGGSTEPQFGRSDVETLRKMADEFVAAYNAKDAAKVAAQFSGAGAVLPPNSSAVRDTEAITAFYVVRFKEGATDLQLEIGEVQGAATVAYITGTFTVRVAPEGQPERRERGKFIWVANDLQGNWRFVLNMWNSDLPIPAPPAAPAEPEKK